MILQALTEYYQALEQKGQIPAPGWSPVKVSFALCLGDNGTLEQVVSIPGQIQQSVLPACSLPTLFPGRFRQRWCYACPQATTRICTQSR